MRRLFSYKTSVIAQGASLPITGFRLSLSQLKCDQTFSLGQCRASAAFEPCFRLPSSHSTEIPKWLQLHDQFGHWPQGYQRGLLRQVYHTEHFQQLRGPSPQALSVCMPSVTSETKTDNFLSASQKIYKGARMDRTLTRQQDWRGWHLGICCTCSR